MDDSFFALVRLFLSTLLPDNSIRGFVRGAVVGIAIGFALVVVSEVIRSPPSSPFRCDDPSLQALQERDILPTAPYLLVVWASSHAVVLVNEMWRPGVSWTDATYWAARHTRRLFVGLVISGDITSIIKMAFNSKRPFFIDACQPAVRLPNGTEVLVCSGRPVAPGPRSGVPSVFGGGEHSEYRRVSSRTPVTGDVTDYRCTGPKGPKSGDSFPSGHAAVAGFAAVFMFGYSIRRCVGFEQPCRAAFLAVYLGALVLVVCLQRVLQHKHFPEDVVCGSVFGAVMALVFVVWPYGDAKATA
ncbi:hypothetical protein HPB51_019647 [Rhipicephalus microplus]|uniref:Phosphatidic acid phosphatase type 2/haloperoxidase domain-containing protein n=1 Tax=Rhipicephalus microplus TaxID=6941 RepID=A0A9J6EBJ2_RHIMP|nr:uncharacterized protein LOC119164882 [Rhipicephalus microplus]KAH8031633.1 hypothetical protein HPB51_019647 [Rhipicephalus microplus]